MLGVSGRRYCLDRDMQGFTLVELMIVLVIAGILSAIALPAFLNQANQAKQVEAKMLLGTLNRAQQAYITEHAKFADDLAQLGTTIRSTGNYRYSVSLGTTGNGYVVHSAESLNPHLKPIVGMVGLVNNSGDLVVRSVLCEAPQPTLGKATEPVYSASDLHCHAATRSTQ